MDMGAWISCRHGIPQFMHKVDRWASLLDSETPACKDFLVDDRVEIDEASGEFELFSINGDGAVRGLSFLYGHLGKVLLPHREKPTHLRFLKLQETGNFAVVGNVQFEVFYTADRSISKK